MKRSKRLSNLDFRIMSFFFKIRDKLNPPKVKIKNLDLKSGYHVLDYGAGTGSYTIVAAKIVGPKGKVHAADVHPLSIKKIKKRSLKNGLSNIETILTNCETKLINNSIDMIICFDVYHEINDKNCILKEFNRILKPNAVLALSDHHLKENDLIIEITEKNLFTFHEKKGNIILFKKI
ncbi:MAG: class I SAM-dependent methyltransferase [Promethearchaeota archaeon]